MSRLCYYDEKMGVVPFSDEPQEKPKPTNADRIRAMTDEELAHFLDNDSAGGCPATDVECWQDCERCWLNWLKEEVTS